MTSYIELGREAAQASLDAHGERVAPAIAYDFITTQAVDDDDPDFPTWERLPMEWKIGFLEGYFHGTDGGAR
jgi:hypothetical protein